MTSDDQRPPDDNAYPEGDDEVSELESAEQYVRAHELIESLRAERRPARDVGGEEDARLSATAALLHAASPENGEVAPTFAARLFARLELEQARQATAPVTEPAQSLPHAEPQPTSHANEATRVQAAPQRRTGVSRRGVLLGGLGAAAALTGAAVTAALEQSRQQSHNAPPTGALVPEGVGIWVAIAALDAVPLGAVKRFEAGAVIGYLQHTASGFVALSGVCTHMACLLQWNSGDQTFDCPCHGGRFLTNGEAAPGARYTYPPLPAIQTKVESEQVWVYVTGGAVNDQYPPSQATSTPRSYGATTSPEVK
ncbi:MAG TPA: Rieske (2Fe-2S) protein [Ktedonobacterales bacterium]